MDILVAKDLVGQITGTKGFVFKRNIRMDEPQLTGEEIKENMERILIQDPGLFLSKWGEWIPIHEFEKFDIWKGLDKFYYFSYS